jgi:predicted ATP-dependent serine protease
MKLCDNSERALLVSAEKKIEQVSRRATKMRIYTDELSEMC